MFFPYSVDVPMVRYPFANWALMAVIVVASIGDWVVQNRSSNQGRVQELNRQLDVAIAKKDAQKVQQVLAELAALEDDVNLPLALKPHAFKIWQLVTHIFAHGDIFHLAGNLLFLFVFGNAVDAKLGHLLFVPAFLIAGIIGGIAWLIFGKGMPMVGASGAIMGVMGVFLVHYPRNDITVFYWVSWFWHGDFRLSSWILIIVYLLLDLLFTFIDPNGGVAYVAHLGGAVFGIALAVGLLMLGWAESEHYEENLLQMMGWAEKTPRYGKKRRRVLAED